MKTGLDHLPAQKTRELQRILTVLHEEFTAKIANATQPHRRNGKILKVILFGSYARGDWVEDHKGRYFSDFDLLIIVDHPDFTDVVDYWQVAEQRLLQMKTPVQFIVHTLDEVNTALKDGQYFFFDIIQDGVMLYELQDGKNGSPKYRLTDPTPPDAKRAYEMAKEYCEHWGGNAKASLSMAQSGVEKKLLNEAAFNLHQATERAYSAFLLTHTLYTPKSHDIEKLRTRCEEINNGLREAWPRGQKPYDRYFKLLKRAYVEARYSKHYKITAEELAWLAGCVEQLIEVVDAVCEKHLAGSESK
ncbi:MAG: HEPN domain-containing protein [Amylibacter sp.]